MREHTHPNGTRLLEYENGSVGVYSGDIYKTVLEKPQLEALAVYLGAALPVEPGRYLDAFEWQWYLRPDGVWIFEGEEMDPIEYMPFTKAD